jgi:hypothetical protein
MDLMNIISWNCRGAGGPRKQRFLRDLIISTRADIAFISETKSSSRKAVRYLRRLPMQHFDYIPSQGLSGGLWLVWGGHIQLTVFEKNRFFMFAWVHSVDKPSWILVVVYGDASY